MATDKSDGQDKAKPFRWGFASAAGVVIALLVVGQIVGRLLGDWPPTATLLRFLHADPEASQWLGALFTVMGVRDWVLLAFFVSAGVFLWLQRAAVLRFLRSMHAGVALLSLATLAVFAGVLVPQIEGFEDPEERVTEANYERNFRDFAWAESYFLYHILHPYGIGMPQTPIPAEALDNLERFGQVYGEEERDNREKMMRASFSGGAKVDEIDAFLRRHDGALRTAFDVATFLEFNRAYKSDWFATLMILIFCAVAANTFRPGMSKKWFTQQKIGFFVTHLGIQTMLVGGLVSHLMTDRGILELYLGEEPQSVYNRHYRGDKFSKMPFELGLERFARKEWKALEVYALEEDFKTRPPRYTLWPGREVPLDWSAAGDGGEQQPRLLVRVAELHDHAEVGTPLVSEGPAEGGPGALPVVALEVPDVDARSAHPAEDPARRTAYLSPVSGNQGYFDPMNQFRLVVGHAVTAESLFPDEPGRVVGTLDVEVRTALEDHPIPVRARLGETVDLPGGWKVEFVDATSDLDVRETDRERLMAGSTNRLPLEQQANRIKAVWVDIHPPDGGESERRLILEAIDPIENGLQEGYEHADVIARLRWDRWFAPGPPRFALVWDAQGKAELVSEAGERTTPEPGQRLALPGPSEVTLTGLYQNAQFEKNITFRDAPAIEPDGFDPSFYTRDPRGVVLEVVYEPGTEREETERITLASTELGRSNLWFTPDERFALVFLENTEGFPYDWRSVLTVWKTDPDGRRYKVDAGTPKQREIRVNDYFKYGGYRFFQTNAKAEDPTYSGIGVVYDPGIPLVLAGMYTIILGTVLAFMVRPILEARRKRVKPA
jgi:hypothetical protein